MEDKEVYVRYETKSFFPHGEEPTLDYVIVDRLNKLPLNNFVHSHSEINFCFEGKGLCSINGEKYDIGPNFFYLVNPMEIHANGTNNQCSFYILGMPNVTFDMADYKSRCISSKGNHLRFLIESLISLINNPCPDQATLIRENFHLILKVLKSDLKAEHLIKVEQGPSDPFDAIIKYIESSFMQKIDIDLLSKKFNFSKSTIMHRFKKRYGVSVMEYTMQQRLKEATFQLEILDESIQKIAAISGFSSTPYFYKYFTRKMGMTPQKYRSMHKQKMQNN